jgi:FAD/FMN-containing dehydrogenase
MSTTPGAGGIAHGLQQNIRGRVLALGQPGFSAAAHLFNPRFDHTVPSAVAWPIDAVDVRDAVRYLVSKATPMAARSGGHSYA